MNERISCFARAMKQQLKALYLASHDPRTPIAAKCLVVMVVAYALSPIDLIPDFIPVIGLLDDLLLVPLGIYWAIQLIPQAVWAESLHKASENNVSIPRNRFVGALIISIWLLGIIGLGWWVLLNYL